MSTANVNVLAYNTPSALAGLATVVATGEIGVEEVPKGSNTGPRVNQYLRAVNLGPGHPWCMAFVNFCYEVAAKKMGVPEPLPNIGHVLTVWNQMPAANKIAADAIRKNPKLLLPGDVFILKIGTKGNGHTGIVAKGVSRVYETAEGNTNDDGGREGFKVAKRIRKIDAPEFLGVIRI